MKEKVVETLDPYHKLHEYMKVDDNNGLASHFLVGRLNSFASILFNFLFSWVI